MPSVPATAANSAVTRSLRSASRTNARAAPAGTGLSGSAACSAKRASDTTVPGAKDLAIAGEFVLEVPDKRRGGHDQPGGSSFAERLLEFTEDAGRFAGTWAASDQLHRGLSRRVEARRQGQSPAPPG